MVGEWKYLEPIQESENTARVSYIHKQKFHLIFTDSGQHVSNVMCHISRFMCHVSGVTCDVSCVMCQVSQFFSFFLYKGGS